MGSEVLPEERVQDVSGEVEGERSFHRRQPREVGLQARFVELIECVVGCFHIPGVMLVVVKLHDAS